MLKYALLYVFNGERERKKYCGTFSMECKIAGRQIIVWKFLKTSVSRGQKLLVIRPWLRAGNPTYQREFNFPVK
jgi:hypothetical protein